MGRGARLLLSIKLDDDKPVLYAFPVLGSQGSGYRRTSPPCWRYNCIAWAAGDTEHWWWPHEDSYWPPKIPIEETLDAFTRAFATLGYRPCQESDVHEKFERVAIFALNGKPTHASYQLPSGLWTSKMGEEVDCEHKLHAVGGAIYGEVAILLRRKCHVKRRNHPAIRS
jgi:hypothetical protein